MKLSVTVIVPKFRMSSPSTGESPLSSMSQFLTVVVPELTMPPKSPKKELPNGLYAGVIQRFERLAVTPASTVNTTIVLLSPIATAWALNESGSVPGLGTGPSITSGPSVSESSSPLDRVIG